MSSWPLDLQVAESLDAPFHVQGPGLFFQQKKFAVHLNAGQKYLQPNAQKLGHTPFGQDLSINHQKTIGVGMIILNI